jgi:outer membrane protein assembly factor BamA
MIFKILFIIFIPCSLLFSFNDSVNVVIYPIKIDSITVTGNDLTDAEIILREITFSEGDHLTEEIILYNRERIYSLGIFNEVNIFFNIEEELTTLIIHVEESWYIYPLPFVDVRERDFSKISYGISLLIKNFRGRNETLATSFSLGYNPSIFFTYYVPYFIWDEQISLRLDLFYRRAANVSAHAERLINSPFEYKIYNFDLSIGKRINLFNRARVFAGFYHLEAPFAMRGITASGKKQDNVLSLGTNYFFDTRDLSQFPTRGVMGSATIQFKGLGIDDINYRVLGLDFRNYHNLFDELHFKWRLAARITGGEHIPFYDFSFLGLAERIRGNFFNLREGHEYYIGAAEFYYPVIKEWMLKLDFIPLIPKELLHYRVALWTNLFFDSGTTRMKRESFALNKFYSGYGAGIAILFLPYNIIRLEAAFDEYKNLEWIIDFGTSF